MKSTLLLLTAALSLIGCNNPIAEEAKKAAPRKESELQTIDHDGHQFVVLNGYQKAAILHHPGCKCVK
jgi:hypothetical protein